MPHAAPSPQRPTARHFTSLAARRAQHEAAVTRPSRGCGHEAITRLPSLVSTHAGTPQPRPVMLLGCRPINPPSVCQHPLSVSISQCPHWCTSSFWLWPFVPSARPGPQASSPQNRNKTFARAAAAVLIHDHHAPFCVRAYGLALRMEGEAHRKRQLSPRVHSPFCHAKHTPGGLAGGGSSPSTRSTIWRALLHVMARPSISWRKHTPAQG